MFCFLYKFVDVAYWSVIDGVVPYHINGTLVFFRICVEKCKLSDWFFENGFIKLVIK